jgi:NADPH-dependent curcumin reductase CurA
MPLNHQIRLAARPSGLPVASDWELTTASVPEPGRGEFVVAVSHLSIDPAMRRWIDTAPSFSAPVELGEVMEAGALGRVIASNHEGFIVGEHLYGAFGVQEFSLGDGTGVTKLDPLIAPLDAYLGALGITGLTAYFGLLEVGHPEPGDTVVISGAAGAVGSVAGQIARIKGCRVIGIAGGPAKCAWLTDELGFDVAIDYKAEDVSQELQGPAPDGVNVFLDNVGGDVLDAVLTRLARGARIVICGATSQYNAQQRRGPANYLSLLDARAAMIGMLTPDYADRYAEARADLAGWIRDGRLISRQDILVGGVAAFPDALLKLFAGKNVGKLVLAVP